MAVSPAISRSPATATSTSAAAPKSGSLTLRSPVNFQSEPKKDAGASQPEPELAEQLNDEARRKYVKGKVTNYPLVVLRVSDLEKQLTIVQTRN